MCNYRRHYEINVSSSGHLRGQLGQYGCRLPNWNSPIAGEDQFCILHSRDIDKDEEQFYQEFKKCFEEFTRSNKRFEFIGFIFPKGFSFRRLENEIGTPLTFKNALFDYSIFYCQADFRSSVFDGGIGARFSRCEFKNGVDFSDVMFNEGTADFSNTKFMGDGDVDFSGSVFKGSSVIFENAVFSTGGKVKFNSTRFLDLPVNFGNTAFLGKAGIEFQNALFHNNVKVCFGRARFITDASVDFTRTQFSGKSIIDFSRAAFIKGDANFSSVQFWNDLEVSFEDTVFNNRAIFKESEFKTIQTSSLKVKASFVNARFGDGVEFIGSSASSNSAINFVFPKEYETNFKNATFEEPEKVVFNRVNLSKARLLGTNLSGARFLQVDWVKGDKARNRLRVYDELFVAEENGYWSVSYLYKQLRNDYEKVGNYFEAGDFFIGEMEMRRLGDYEKCYIRKVLWIYKAFSIYGESPLRAIKLIAVFCALFSFVHIFIGLTPNDEILKSNIIGINVIKWNVDLSQLAITALKIKSIYLSFIESQKILPLLGSVYHLMSGLLIPVFNFVHDLLQAFLVVVNNITLGRFETPYVLDPKSLWYPFLKGFEFLFGAITIPLFLLAMNRKFRRTKD